MKAKCQDKARELAALELSVWDANHEQQLIRHFGYTPKSVATRKRELISNSNNL